jgi:hypothetical protein
MFLRELPIERLPVGDGERRLHVVRIDAERGECFG